MVNAQAREQLLELIMSSTTAMHAAMCFLNFVLLALLQLKYQNIDHSPFEAHGTIILLYILTSFVYSTALIALLLRPHQLLETLFLVTLEYISLLSGALTCDLLLLILVPPFGYFLLALCGVLILVKALLRSYQQILGHLLDVAAISEIARDLIPNVFHRSSRHQEAHIQAYSMVSPSINRVSTNHNSTDHQGGGDASINTTQTVGV